MTKAHKIAQVEATIAYTFINKDLIWEALQVAGSTVTQAGDRYFPDGNKRLAILGDRIAEQIFTAEWYETGHTKGRHHFVLGMISILTNGP